MKLRRVEVTKQIQYRTGNHLQNTIIRELVVVEPNNAQEHGQQ